MQAHTWARVKDLLPRALAHATGQRQQVALSLAGNEPRVLDELRSLLAVHEDGPGTLPGVQATFAQAAVQQALAPSWVGRRLGPWRVESLLARGGMGEVYLARRADGQFDSRVALKCMRGVFEAPTLLPRFENERRILSSLDHPNLARIIDGGISDDGLPYFVMEYVDGEPLDVYCRRLELAVPQRLSLFMSLCRVVEYVHQKGVVHRDLKFSNILVTREGLLKLVDFGIAKRLQVEGAELATQTATALRPLTLAFASPEQVAGLPTTPASDIYSLGVVLYRLLAGAGPYRHVDPHNGYALAKAICEQEPEPPSRAATGLAGRLRTQLRGDLDAVVLRALRKHPAHRYASADSLAEDLARHLQCRPVQARHGDWTYRASRFMQRHRGLVTAAAVATLAAALGLGFSLHQASQAERQRSQAAQNLARVRELANLLVFEIGGRIERQPGNTAARKLAMERGLASLQQLAAETDHDPALNFEIASALYRIGEGQGRFGDYTAGTAADADRNLAAAQHLLETALTGLPPGSELRPKSQHLLAVVLGRRNTLAIEEFGDRAAAARFLARKLELAQTLADSDPDLRYQHLLANAHNELAWLHDDQPAVFRAESDRALDLLDKLWRRAPDDRGVNSILANVLLARGHHELAYGASHQAEPFLQRSLSLYQALDARYPNDAELRLMLAEVHSALGSALQGRAAVKDAVALHRRAIALVGRLLAMEPGNVMFRIELAMKQDKFAVSLQRRGDVTGAVAMSRMAYATLGAVDTRLTQAGTLVPARMDVTVHLAQNLDTAHGPASHQACPYWMAAQKLLAAFTPRAGGLAGDVNPAKVIAAARACSGRNRQPGTGAPANTP